MDRIYSIFIFGIIFNILFSMFGFAFTTFASQPSETFEIIIDQDVLWEEGIVFLNATSFEIDYNGGWSYFTENNKKFRLQWYDPIIPVVFGAGIHIQQQDVIEQYTDTWAFPKQLSVQIGEQKHYSKVGITNASMITYWEPDNNWTRFSFGNGYLGFLSTFDNNITRAVDEGSLNVTLGDPESDQYDVGNFVDWYWDSLFYWNVSGIPGSISVFTKLLTTLNFVSAIIVIRELFRL